MENHIYLALNSEQDQDHVTMELALNFELEKDGKAPEWLPLMPAGSVTGRDGRTFHNANPEAVINATRSVGRDIPWDIEHATEIKGPQGEPAPAQAWSPISELEVRDGVIWGKVNWNNSGRELIEGEAYKYYSPAFYTDKDGRVIRIKSIGLTNTQNLRELPALNNQDPQTQPGGTDMALPAAIRQALGLPETADEAAAVSAIGTLKTDHQLALNRAENPDGKKFIPVETHQLALNRAETAEKKLDDYQQKEVEAEVDAAIEARKIAPANKEHFLAMCRQDGGLDNFREMVKAMPEVISTEEGKGGKKPEGGQQTKLDETELAMCRQMGLSEEDYLKEKQQLAL